MKSMLTVAPSAAGEPTRLEDWDCPEVTPEAVWKAVLGAVRAVWAGDNKRELIKITLGTEVAFDGELLPAPDGSESSDAWLARMRRKAGPDTPVLLYARELASHDRDLFELLLSACGRTVFERHGLVSGNIDIEVFLGEYSATPGGIHREQCGNSHFVVEGRKFMHFWHGEEWIPQAVVRQKAEGDNAVDPEEYLPSLAVPAVVERGVSLLAKAGQFFTWDPGTWHVAETVGPALALNIARYTRSFTPGEGTYPFTAEADGRVDDAWLAGCQEFLGEPDLAQTLAAVSAYGLVGAEAAYEVPATVSRVAVRSLAPRLWHAARDEVLVATHGRCHAAPASVLPWYTGLAGLPVGTERSVPADDDTQALARFLIANGALRPSGIPAS